MKKRLEKIFTSKRTYIVFGAVLVCVAIALSVFSFLPKKDANGPKTTLMIYMVGSDLESKSAAASDDLEEIKNSGIDLSKANVIVYAGGTTRWHNDIIENEEENTILQLKENGFEVISSSKATSMGEAECLSEFLNYCYENYSAEEYSLIMWNHGNGPVIGYGKDILFDNNSLTLVEMKEALENSPFKGENKLDWVGFDACLMASAELSYVWADHADYLLASQEVEPSFGWDYSFLKNLGISESKDLLASAIDDYHKYCTDYYESKGRMSQFTTLSCVELSYIGDLESAVNDLFQKAEKDIKYNYNSLAAKRVETQELGRASANFEYDLIDLYDAAKQLESLYPAEAKEVCAVLDKMIIKNVSDTETCHGMSIYYPFYNKDYYQESWGDIYHELGFFDGYQNYLNSYQKIWFSSNEPDAQAADALLEEESSGTYTLRLTDEQNETFADAAYYILKREGDGLYTTIFSSHDVTNQDGLLTASFDGNVIYAKNNFDEYLIPVSTEHDTAGDYTRYSIYMGLSNYDSAGYMYSSLSGTAGEEYMVEPYRFQLALNNKTGDISTTALVPYDLEADANTLVGGKLKDADLSQWNTYNFIDSKHIYPTKYDSGALKPISQWTSSSSFSWVEMPIGDGLTFSYEPLAGGEYYILFEVEDTCSSKFCSELLPITVAGGPKPTYNPDPIDIEWTSGDRMKLGEKDGVSLYIKTLEEFGHLTYTFEAENTNNFPITVNIRDIRFNGDVYFGSEYFEVAPGETGTLLFDSGLDLKHMAYANVLDNLEFFDFNVTIKNTEAQRTLMKHQPFTVHFSDQTAISAKDGGYEPLRFTGPYLEAFAGQQTLFNSDGVRVTLLGFGETNSALGEPGFLCIENTSSVEKIVSVEAMAINGITSDTGVVSKMILPPKSKYYESFRPLYLDDNNISSINSIKIAVALWQEYAFSGGFGKITWCDVKLSQKSSALQPFDEGDTVLFEEHGVRISLKDYDNIKNCWSVTITNNSDHTLRFSPSDVKLDSQAASSDLISCASLDMVGPHQKLNAEINYWGDKGDIRNITFTLNGMNFSEETILFVGSVPITLSLE